MITCSRNWPGANHWEVYQVPEEIIFSKNLQAWYTNTCVCSHLKHHWVFKLTFWESWSSSKQEELSSCVYIRWDWPCGTMEENNYPECWTRCSQRINVKVTAAEAVRRSPIRCSTAQNEVFTSPSLKDLEPTKELWLLFQVKVFKGGYPGSTLYMYEECDSRRLDFAFIGNLIRWSPIQRLNQEMCII